MTGTVGLKSIIETAGLILSSVPRRDVPAYHTGGAWQHVRPVMDTVTVVIPTIDRYPYLGTLLKQLSSQTVKPYEVLIVDQTPLERRQSQLYSEIESDFPIRVVWMDQPGQCSSRNAAINMATGEKILLLDDDIEVRANFIESHLKMFSLFRCDVSSGVSVEAAAPLSRDFQRIRVSDVFPAGNSMVNRKTLMQSGLFDIAYDKSERADADLGMRIFKTGALMVLNPGIDVLHHKADRGGLRNHRARVITYASSRDRLLHRHLPSVSEIYFARRYFHPSQVREMLWLRGMGTLAGRGHLLYRIAKAVIGIVLLPTTVRQIWKRYDASALVFRNHPQIPTLADSARAVSTVQ
jgi:glycosyltransferase involved in cell wall biosynthesis